MLNRSVSDCIKSFIVVGLGLALGACSHDDGAKRQALPPPPVEKHSTPTPPNPDYCPGKQLLVKRHLFWGTSNGWATHTPSFSNHISAFLGAQWQGLNDGKILCIYRGDKGDFSISLQTNRFVSVPWGAGWEQLHEAHAGTQQATYIINCVSIDPADCPFPKAATVWQGPAASTHATEQSDEPANLGVTPLSN